MWQTDHHIFKMLNDTFEVTVVTDVDESNTEKIRVAVTVSELVMYVCECVWCV